MPSSSTNCWRSLKNYSKVILEAAREAEEWCLAETKKEDEKAWKALEQMPDIKIWVPSEEEVEKWREAGLPPQIEKFKGALDNPQAVDHLLEVVEKYR